MATKKKALKTKLPSVDEILKNWTTFTTYISKCDKATLLHMLKKEETGKNRVTFLNRIESRLNRIRANEVRLERLEKTKKRLIDNNHV